MTTMTTEEQKKIFSNNLNKYILLIVTNRVNLYLIKTL